MVENNKNKDYQERFEFRFMKGNNVICGRYFKIENFNPHSLCSIDLKDAMDVCADMIDKDLIHKSRVYLQAVAPRFFQDKEEMDRYFNNPETGEYNVSQMKWNGEGLVLRDENDVNYVWDGKTHQPVEAPTQFFDGELTKTERITYKLSFYDNGREVMSKIWEGAYPKGVRKSIDLSNRVPSFEKPTDPFALGFEQYLKYICAEGQPDLNYQIIKTLCEACSLDTDEYETSYVYDTVGKDKKVVDSKTYTNRYFEWYAGEQEEETEETQPKKKQRNTVRGKHGKNE